MVYRCGDCEVINDSDSEIIKPIKNKYGIYTCCACGSEDLIENPVSVNNKYHSN